MSIIRVREEFHELLLSQRTSLRDVYPGSAPSEEQARDFELAVTQHFSRRFESIKPYLPEQGRCVVDIGCGLAIMDVLLYRHYGGAMKSLNLVDRTQVEDEIWYGYKQQGAYYNSLQASRALLEDNGVPAATIHLINASENALTSVEGKADLVMSLLSWGWHYPVETYLHQVLGLCHERTRLLIDIRKDTGGEDVLRKHFRRVDPIPHIDRQEKGQTFLASSPRAGFSRRLFARFRSSALPRWSRSSSNA